MISLQYHLNEQTFCADDSCQTLVNLAHNSTSQLHDHIIDISFALACFPRYRERHTLEWLRPVGQISYN